MPGDLLVKGSGLSVMLYLETEPCLGFQIVEVVGILLQRHFHYLVSLLILLLVDVVDSHSEDVLFVLFGKVVSCIVAL